MVSYYATQGEDSPGRGFLEGIIHQKRGLGSFGVYIEVYTTGKFQNMLKLILTAVEITGIYIATIFLNGVLLCYSRGRFPGKRVS